MNKSHEFLKSILDTVTEHIVVIDGEGGIRYVNRSWNNFGQNNLCLIGENWDGVNYLTECDKADAMGDDYGGKAADGIRQVIKSEREEFYFEYPCHSPVEQRWFTMRVTPFLLEGSAQFVISHQNITERKLAEEEVRNLARIDGLTGIPNRRALDEFLEGEWKRCARLSMPLSLAIIDLDHFKLINDTYGHQAGDECLKTVGAALTNFAKRPSDICARYGGEEFAVVYGNTSLKQARDLLTRLNDEIRALQIPNKMSPVLPTLTASTGLATFHPNRHDGQNEIIKRADALLYSAKESGRNRIECFDCRVESSPTVSNWGST